MEVECSNYPNCGMSGFNGEKRVDQVIQAADICPTHKRH